jgi:hypothetical protein
MSTTYRDVLYPAPGQLQEIQNRRALDQFLEMRDDHAIARIVDHAIYFRSALERADYASEAVELGFGIQHGLRVRRRPRGRWSS